MWKPPPFQLVSVLPLQFRAEMFPTLSSDYHKMHCQSHFYDEMNRTCKKTNCRTDTERKIIVGAENNKFLKLRYFPNIDVKYL